MKQFSNAKTKNTPAVVIKNVAGKYFNTTNSVKEAEKEVESAKTSVELTTKQTNGAQKVFDEASAALSNAKALLTKGEVEIDGEAINLAELEAALKTATDKLNTAKSLKAAAESDKVVADKKLVQAKGQVTHVLSKTGVTETKIKKVSALNPNKVQSAARK